jgi:PAS domain S-box-containing protein
MVAVPQDIAKVDGNRPGNNSQQAEVMLPLLRFILDRSSDAAFCFEAQGRLVYANKTACQWLGYSPKELLRLSVRDIIPDLSLTAWMSHLQVIQQDGSLTLKSRHRSKEGRIFPVELTINSLTINGREYYCTLVRDPTKQSSVAAALQQSETRFQKLAAHVPGMIYQFRLQPHGEQSFSYVSSSCRELFDLEPEAIQQDAMLLINLVHPDERESFEQSIIHSAQTLQPWSWQGQFVMLSGESRWVQAVSRPERQVNGDIVWDGLLIDISDRKRAELAVQQHLAAMEASIDGMAILNADGEYTYLNAAHAQIYGYHRPEELLGKSWRTLYDADELSRFEQDIMPNFWQQGQWRGETAGKRRDGSTFPQELSLTALEDGGLVCVVRDITERKQAECALQQAKEQLENRVAERTSELQRANEQLRIKIEERQQVEDTLRQTLQELQQTQAQLIQTEKLSSIGQLVAGIAHEINNPVSFIYGNLPHANQYIKDLLNLIDLYQQHYPHPAPAIQDVKETINFDFLVEDLPKLLSSMKIGADRIRQIVLSLRNFSRLDEAERKPVDLHEGIDNTLLLLKHRLKAKGDRPDIQLIKEYGQLPLVECYAGQLNQVFMNLLSNAIDALEESVVGNEEQPSPCIWIHTEVQDDGRVAIRIADNGTGITEEARQRIFDPFFTTKPVGKGTGLGLSISYQIVVEKHGGQLQCFSNPNQGTEFLIQMPIQSPIEKLPN